MIWAESYTHVAGLSMPAVVLVIIAAFIAGFLARHWSESNLPAGQK